MCRRLFPYALTCLLLASAGLGCDTGASGQGAWSISFPDSPAAGALGDLFFPDQPVGGAPAALTVQITSVGDADLRLSGAPAAQLERDNRLAYRVTQPDRTRLTPGQTTSVVVRFTPTEQGAHVARLLIPTDAGGPIIVGLNGNAVQAETGGAAVLGAYIGEDPISAPLDFGTASPDAAATRTVRLVNLGTDRLTFAPSAPITFTGPAASAFTAGALALTGLDPAEAINVSVVFAPTGCGAATATVEINSDAAGDPVTIDLVGQGVVVPVRFTDVMGTPALSSPPSQIALAWQDDPTSTRDAEMSDVPAASGSSDLGAQMIWGDLSDDSYAGGAWLLNHDGCQAEAPIALEIPPADRALGQIGTAVDISYDGKMAAVTAMGNDRVWLFDADAGAQAADPFRLSTSDVGSSHGYSVAIAGQGSTVVVGQPRASSSGIIHGAAYAFKRDDGVWSNQGEAHVKLLPAAQTLYSRFGASVDVSGDGAMIAVSGIYDAPNDIPRAVALVYDWHAADGTWGRERLATNNLVRDESYLLRASGPGPADAADPSVSLAGNGRTLVLTVPQADGTVICNVFLKQGATWGRPAGEAGFRQEDLRLYVDASLRWRARLSRSGDLIAGADGDGLQIWRRPALGWEDAMSPTQTWAFGFDGGFDLSPDGGTVGGLDEGDVLLVWP